MLQQNNGEKWYANMREATAKAQKALVSATGISAQTVLMVGVCFGRFSIWLCRMYKHLRMTDFPSLLISLIEFHLQSTPPHGHPANCLDFMFSNQIHFSLDKFFFSAKISLTLHYERNKAICFKLIFDLAPKNSYLLWKLTKI